MAIPHDEAAVELADRELLHVLAEEIVLAIPAVEQMLTDAATAAAAGLGLSCGITYVARYGVVTVASSDARANAVDEIQYGAGDGPCLEAMRDGAVVRVEDLRTDSRWAGYRKLALRAGVRSSVSFPLFVDGRSVGALNVYSTEVGPWAADQEAAAVLAASQAASVLDLVLGLAGHLTSDTDAARDLRDRHELDIATGMMMARHGYGDVEARAALVQRSADDGTTVRAVVSQMLRPSGPDRATRSAARSNAPADEA